MRIAVNTRFLLKDQLEGLGYCIYENFSRITRAHPEHEFLFIFDRPYDNRFIFGPNVTPVIARPAARHPLLFKYWFDVSVPAALRKHKADVFVSFDGFCSLTTRVPQCLMIHDLAFLHYPGFIKRSHRFFYSRYTPKFLKKAASIVTVSEFSKRDIVAHYNIDPAGITVVPNAARNSFRPLSLSEKEAVRKQYTDGREYFIYTGAIHPRKNLTNLLKAFSIFKRRQRSNWKLVLAGRLAWKYEGFVESLKTYKYRDDVILTGYVHEDELTRLTGSAYAMIYPSYWEGFGMPVLEAIAAGVVPVTSRGSAMEEIAKSAAVYADPASHEDIAEKMMLLYKDEGLRSQLITNGREIGAFYNWDKSAAQLWRIIEETAKAR
jgi:glycosyltransferase involved in cell wall biosynthesis